jgi:hypothetical protein
MTQSLAPSTSPSSEPLRTGFLALLPKLRTHALIYFRDVACPDTRADKVAETVALAWAWYRRLHKRGKDVARFPMAFVFLVARAVKCGRRLCGQEKRNDVLSLAAQQCRGFRVQSLPSSTRASVDSLYSSPHGQDAQDAYEELLRDNRQTPVPDQVAFRLDLPCFLRSLSERDRRLAAFLALGHSATRAAAAFGMSPARVTQLRQGWCRQWRRCQDEDPFPT